MAVCPVEKWNNMSLSSASRISSQHLSKPTPLRMRGQGLSLIWSEARISVEYWSIQTSEVHGLTNIPVEQVQHRLVPKCSAYAHYAICLSKKYLWAIRQSVSAG